MISFGTLYDDAAPNAIITASLLASGNTPDRIANKNIAT